MHAQGSYYLNPAVSLWDGSADYLSFIDRKLNYHCSGACLQALVRSSCCSQDVPPDTGPACEPPLAHRNFSACTKPQVMRAT